VDDLILSFGTECITLSNLANLVHENEPISVVVEREGRIVLLTLVPKKWTGDTMLGIRLEELDSSDEEDEEDEEDEDL